MERFDGPLVVARAVELKLLLRRSLAVSFTARRWSLEAEIAETLESAARPRASTWVVAVEAGEALGALFTTGAHEDSQCFIRWIIVDPAYRQCGIGDRLVDELERTTSARRLTGMVDLDDPVASSFWRSRGFVAIRGGSGRILMGRELRAGVT